MINPTGIITLFYLCIILAIYFYFFRKARLSAKEKQIFDAKRRVNQASGFSLLITILIVGFYFLVNSLAKFPSIRDEKWLSVFLPIAALMLPGNFLLFMASEGLASRWLKKFNPELVNFRFITGSYQQNGSGFGACYVIAYGDAVRLEPNRS
ncbi:hypothetical protein DM872_11505 [Pseudomonas taiwanensis]|uniref:hypothetical protein n=1 Tax=Pseudomonas taiwanensis TaxID=470150 RepID=UPI0015B8DB98|nr:hypothetical protein [Pseudomonas taiwanensis]NWL77478.1 hypothetical protein [Pseudomonas taiwanensis]